ncbi:46447_t:CDS:2 [Gigaspora margarita]|uniref:46447_t:CDS:1 n=1 Tax=Gigaspora margarita TaxID=4874 RepID=A0ABN7V0C9_GIGMA|nr:46447_t:CDS:2 [Gigaspora margarita]
MKQKQWVEAKFLWIENLLPHNKLKTGCMSLFGSLSELFFEQFFRDSLNWNLLIIKSTIMTSCDSDYCSKKIMSLANVYDIKTATVSVVRRGHLYLCTGKATSTRHIDRQLPLILVVNVAGINITDKGFYLEYKDLLEEISFPSEDAYIKQKYRLMRASFCDGNYHVANVHFENVKNVGWYQYDSLGKTYRARAMYIGSSCPSHKNSYAMDFAIYVKI